MFAAKFQVQRVCVALAKNHFQELDTVEILQRSYDIRQEQVAAPVLDYEAEFPDLQAEIAGDMCVVI